LGAAGVGLFGILRTLLQYLATLASANGQTALVQGVASAPTPAEQSRFGIGVFQIQSLLCLGLVGLMLATAPWLGHVLIPHPDAPAIVRWLSLAVVGLVAQGWVLGILNGHGRVNDLVLAQFVGPVAVLLLIRPMVSLVHAGHSSAFVIMLGVPPLVVSAAGFLLLRRGRLLPVWRGWRVDGDVRRRFLRMAGVMLLAAAITTGGQYLQGRVVAARLGLAVAGHYWTAWTLSMAYVTLLLGSYASYYLPSLSQLTDSAQQQNLIRVYLRLALVLMPQLVGAVVIVKPAVVRLVFSDELIPALSVMRWMLIGDLLKGVSWVLALPMLASTHLRWYMCSEVLFAVGLSGTGICWVMLGGGVEGLGAIFLVSYAIYLGVVAWYARAEIGFRWAAAELIALAGGLCLVISLSAVTWNEQLVTFRIVAIGVTLAGVFLTAALRGLRRGASV
jgi:PST family polysaccharide transporter